MMPTINQPPPRLGFQSHPWQNRCGFYLIEHQRVTDYPYPQPFQLLTVPKPKWERQPEGFMPSQPSFTLYRDQAQELFDSMWTSGFRPTEQINEAAKLAATEHHLADMRAIAFGKLKIEPPVGDRRGQRT